jgi:hypothetical protein
MIKRALVEPVTTLLFCPTVIGTVQKNVGMWGAEKCSHPGGDGRSSVVSSATIDTRAKIKGGKAHEHQGH